MLSEFTFISVCYNQEDYVVEHLNSIKEQVIRYGDNIEISLIVADDCSKDNTVLKVQKWIDQNTALFKKTLVIKNSSNLGSVKNIYNAIEKCETEQFKILACDDCYNESLNIFEIYTKYENQILITPIAPIVPMSKDSQDIRNYIWSIERDYKLVQYYTITKKLGVLLSIRNFLMAPGVFIPSRYWRDSEIKNEILQFKYIEDYPMWINLFVKKKLNPLIVSSRYIKYRISLSSRKIDGVLVNDKRKNDYIKLKEMYTFKISVYEKIKYYILKLLFTCKTMILLH